jgi:hypothetical protein
VVNKTNKIMNKYKKLELDGVKTYSLKDRKSKVSEKDFAISSKPDSKINEFINNLPDILVAKDFKDFIKAYQNAIEKKSQIVLMMGAHVIKVGLGPVLIDAMKKGFITHLAVNGACVIHDVELALGGSTSEDVAAGLEDGSFGMVEESTKFINKAVSDAKDKMGYGEGVAMKLDESANINKEISILWNAYNLNIPITVHSALGTEIIHQHPSVDGAAIGDTSWTDFKVFSHSLSQLDENSIVLNIGSAVIMPEVFLKALTVVRNLGYDAFGFTAATFDMIKHYRPTVNVTQRPTASKGRGFYFIGHHEIMIPLLFAAIQ